MTYFLLEKLLLCDLSERVTCESIFFAKDCSPVKVIGEDIGHGSLANVELFRQNIGKEVKMLCNELYIGEIEGEIVDKGGDSEHGLFESIADGEFMVIFFVVIRMRLSIGSY